MYTYILLLRRYRFSVLEESGWNFRHAYYHELGRRTLLKAYGVKFIVQVQILEDTEISEDIFFSVEGPYRGQVGTWVEFCTGPKGVLDHGDTRY